MDVEHNLCVDLFDVNFLVVRLSFATRPYVYYKFCLQTRCYFIAVVAVGSSRANLFC